MYLSFREIKNIKDLDFKNKEQKTYNMKIYFLFFISVSYSLLIAQGNFYGYDDKLSYNQGQQLKYFDWIQKNNSKSFENITYSIPIKIWIINDITGNNIGPSDIVYSTIEQINSTYFNQAGINFQICDEETISSNIFSNLNVDDELDDLINSYYTSGFINLYVCNQVVSDDNIVGGVGFSIGFDRDLTAVTYNFIFEGLFAHELGHCLHLRHTHGKFNFNDSDCNSSLNVTTLDNESWFKGVSSLDNDLY